MPHESIRTFAPVVDTLLMTSKSWHGQATTYPNKPTQIITGFALGSGGDSFAIIHSSKFEAQIGQSTALEPLTVKSDYELRGNLINTINFTAQ
jgi:tripartite-type tricarboxylate transporter receptor subunit TctC